MKDLALAGQRVLIREDLNVPIRDGRITSDARIQAALPTLRLAAESGAKVMVMSHLSRPTEGEPDAQYSLAPVAAHLAQLLGQPVRLATDWLDGIDVTAGEIVLCENVRFNIGEKKDDKTLAKRMAALCDIFVMDAFGTAHRAQASTHGVAQFAPVAAAGPLLAAELDALSKALAAPTKPVVAIVGGAKVSTKLGVLESLVDKVDQLIVGGGIANTFIAAAGYEIGQSLYEADLIPVATRLLQAAQKSGNEIPVPTDVTVAKSFDANATATVKSVNEIATDDLVLDVGPETAKRYAEYAEAAGTIVWNGPVGVFEFEAFANGTQVLATAIGASQGFSIAGGGDTLAAIDRFGLSGQISYVSTGGGAFLEFLEGKPLPALTALEARSR